MRGILLGMVLALGLVGASARAEGFGGVRLGLRVGYGLGLGKLSSEEPMTFATAGAIPAELFAGLRLDRHWIVGATASWGFALIDDCPDQASCVGSLFRLGLEAQYHLFPKKGLDPWLAVGSGYEALSESATAAGATVDSSVRGWDILHVTFGLEHRAGGAFSIGPFLRGSFGRYGVERMAERIRGVPQKTFHFWVGAGLQGAFDIE